MSHPSTPTIMNMVHHPCQEAIDKALHDVNPPKWHKRLGDYTCPLCPSSFEKRYEEIRAYSDEELEEWQAKLAKDMLGTTPSPALAKFLDDNKLLADELMPEVVLDDDDPNDLEVVNFVAAPPDLDEPFTTDPVERAADQVIEDRITYQDMTAKVLRPLASAAGMQGARVAKKDDMVEFLVKVSA
jgi:hypothetical protein